MRKKLHNPALEAIAHQDGKFFAELSEAVGTMRKNNAQALQDVKNEDVLYAANVIKRFTGISIGFHLGQLSFSVFIPDINRNHALFNKPMQEYFKNKDAKKMIKDAEGGVLRGTVDLKSAKVTGLFANLPTTICLPLNDILGNRLSNEEIAAIILHEVGHLFVLFEFMNRTATTNQVLAGLSRALDESVGASEREFIIQAAKRSLRLSETNVTELAKTSDQKVIQTVIISDCVRQSISELGSDVYDMNNFEALADQFAARMGAGQELVTGLEKVMAGYRGMDGRGGLKYIFMEAIKFATLALSIAAMFSTATIGLGLYGIFFWAIFTLNDGLMDPTYDRRGIRYARIRGELVQDLKDKKIPPDRREQVLDGIAAIDKIAIDIKDHQQWAGIVYDFIFRSKFSRLRQEKLQSELEKLANSNLFVKSAELKALI
jgi:hypothetical protein